MTTVAEQPTYTLEEIMGAIIAWREEAAKIKAQYDEAKNAAKYWEDTLLGEFARQELRSVTDSTGCNFASVVTQAARIEDFDAFANYVLDNRRLDLMQKRVTSSAVMEMIEQGVNVPGISLYSEMGLRVTGAKNRKGSQ